MKEYTIFISSPDDVKEERNIIENAINETNRYYRHDEKIPKLNLIKLETDVRSIITNQEAQTVIDKQIEGKYNVFIGILWKKFGTPTEKYGSGTEQEFYNAYNKHLEDPNSMDLMFYFCTKDFIFKDVNVEQLSSVEKFKKELQNKKGFYKEYSDIEEFKEIIKNDLIKLVTESITFKENEDAEEDDGLIDLMETYSNNLSKVDDEIKLLSYDINIFSNELGVLSKQKPKTRKETKYHYDSASEAFAEFSNKIEIHNKNITNSFNRAFSAFNSVLKFHGDLIKEEKINKTENAMISVYNKFDAIEKALIDIIKIIDKMRSVTNKFSKSKKSLNKSLKEFAKEINQMKEYMDESKNKLLELKK